MTKHFLFIIPIYQPAKLTGAEVVVQDLAEELASKGNRVTLVTSNALSARYWYDPIFGKKINKRFEMIHDVSIIRLPCNQIISSMFYIIGMLLQRFPKLRNISRNIMNVIEVYSWGPMLRGFATTIRNEKPDYVMVSPFPAGICLSAHNLCKKMNIPYGVIPFFKKDQHLFENRILTGILDDAQVIFTPTDTEGKYIRQYTKNSHVAILPSSIDASYIKRLGSQTMRQVVTLKQTKALNGKKIVLFAGIKGKGKGIIDAAEAVRRLGRNDVVFVAMGHSRPEWQTYVSHHDTKNIIDLQYQAGASKYAYYFLSDVLILPSITDNFPLVFLEAWQFKKPVLAYDFYSMKELVGDGSGFLAENQNIEDLSKHLARILDHPKEAAKAGAIGYAKVQGYTRERITRDYFMKGLFTL